MKVFYHEAFMSHRTPDSHPERPARLEAIRKHLHASPWGGDLVWVAPAEIPMELAEQVHGSAYLEEIRKRCAEAVESGPRMLDSGDTWVVGDSWRAALLAAGAGVAAVDAVLSAEGGESTAFAAVRPPGHHARPHTAMGFCLLANAALAARHAQLRHGVDRVLIVDWDVHHGNGTQEIFYEDPSVLFFSIHESPHWPFSGERGERGAGAGEGYTINAPVGAGSGRRQYEEIFREVLLPTARRFSPELVVISAGFDAHRRDPLSNVALEAEDFGLLTRIVTDLAAETADGRVVSLLEGGYDLEGLRESVAAHLRYLTNS